MELGVKQIDEDTSRNMDSLQKRAPAIGVRHLQSFLLFLCVFSGYLLRVNLSVTIVAMNPEVNSADYRADVEHHVPVFGWRTSTRSVLLSAFFVGYLLANLPASVLGCRYDSKLLLAGSMAASSLLSAATPPAVTAFGAPAMVAVRFVQGLSSAFMFPMVHGIMAKWSPPHERSRLVGFIISGIQLGTMATLALSGVLSSSAMGWPAVYYASAAVGLAWTAAWLLLGSDTVAGHRFVGRAEADYIQASLADTVDHDLKLSDVPWKSIFTSMPVWATTAAHVGHNLGFWLLLTEMPTFIHTVLGFNIKEDGMLSALPYMFMFLLQLPVAYAADALNRRRVTTLTASRKAWNTVAMWGGAAGLVTLGYVDSAETTIVLYVFIVAIGCTSNVGFNINHLDLSPNYAGLLMGITNTCASSGGVVAPLFVGFVVDDPTSSVKWRIVFISGAAVMFLSNLFFIIFGSAETQPWNSLHNDVRKTNNKQENEVDG